MIPGIVRAHTSSDPVVLYQLSTQSPRRHKELFGLVFGEFNVATPFRRVAVLHCGARFPTDVRFPRIDSRSIERQYVWWWCRSSRGSEASLRSHVTRNSITANGRRGVLVTERLVCELFGHGDSVKDTVTGNGNKDVFLLR